MIHVYLLSALLESNQVNIPQNDLTSDGTLKTVLQIITGAAAAVAMLIIVIAGLKYGLSRGNSDEVAKAKDSILYAIAGLILSMAAFSVVTFVVKGL